LAPLKFGRGQGPQEIVDIISECVKLETDDVLESDGSWRKAAA
jgi:hypothetical protein